MIRRLIRVHQRILNTHHEGDVLVGNRTGGKAVAEEPRTNRHPEFLEETMFAEHGTKVLITNPAADQYLDKHSREEEKRKIQQKAEYAKWQEDNF